MKKLIVFIFPILFTVGCYKSDDEDNSCYDSTNPNCANYDPCTAKTPLSSDFVIETWAPVYNGDTFDIGFDHFAPKSLHFRALQEDASYEWILGNETIDAQMFSRDFSQVGFDLNVPVQLTVTKEPDQICFPLDDGTETSSREITITKDLSSFNVMGEYIGVLNDNTDSIKVKIAYDADQSGVVITSEHFDTPIMSAADYHTIISDLVIRFYGSGSASPKGTIVYDYPNNVLTIDYYHNESPARHANNHVYFVGRRI